MIKSFAELSKVEVPITKKPTFTYNKMRKELEKSGDVDTLSWVDCLTCLYDNGAEKVIFENILNENGGLLFKDDNNAITIKVFVEIDGDRREIFYPLMDGTKDVSVEKLTQSDIYNAKQRAFVKCVAVNWGLGIYLWKKEVDPDTVIKVQEVSYSEQFRTLVNNAVKKCGGIAEMLKHLQGVSEKRIKELIEEAKAIDGITKTLLKVVEDDKKSKQE
jgi:hypothetical protein